MISIIIPILNQHEMSAECIQAIMETTTDYEIVVIDNGSDPPFKSPFSGFNEVRVVRNEENKGFPAAVNQGIRAAKGDVIVLLNNDVTVSPGTLNRLADWLENFDIVGPSTNYCAGMQMVQIAPYQSREELDNEVDALFESSQGEGEEVNWIIGFCMVFKKSVWEQVGDFDTTLWPCNGEEIDFSLRAKEKGFKIGIARDIYVHHEGSVTFRDMEDAGQIEYLKICERNDKHLAEKWGADFWNRQAICEDIGTAPKPGLNLNLGSGYRPLEGYVNIDNRAEVNPDLICDIIDGFSYPDNSVDMVRAYDFLEHIPIGKTIDVINEIWRVLKPEGLFDSLTPSTDGRGAFQDPTHVSFWNQNSWRYYSDPAHRHLYGIVADFEIEKIEDITIDDPTIVYTHVIAKARKEFIEKKTMKTDGPLRLNLGCGINKLEGFINIDQFKDIEFQGQHTSPDLVADVTGGLPYDPDTVDEIYCGHLLEHMTWEIGQIALKYWLSLLKPGGIIGVTVPNFDVLAERYLANPTAVAMREMNEFYIFSYIQPSHHKYCYGESLLMAAMAGAGFTDLERLPIDDWHFYEAADWQIGYRGVKPKGEKGERK